jgi:lipopolysaccharide biosynthesis glycosyltransferase
VLTTPRPSGRIDLLLAGDLNVAMPMAATIGSAVRTLRAGESLRVFLLVEGFDAATRARVEALRVGPRPEFCWIDADRSRLLPWPSWYTLPPASGFRVLLGEALPTDVRRAIYLDTDVVLRASVTELAETDLGNAVVGATPDPSISWLGVSVDRPVWRKFGLPPDAPYFNAGILVVDVDCWREAGIGEAALGFLRAHSEHVARPVQDALNVVLADRWRTGGPD